MTDRTILIVGAGGQFGRHIAPGLLAKGRRVRGLVHHDRAEEIARSTGVMDIARANLRDEDAVRCALEGVGAVFYIPPKFLPDESHLGVRLIELAKEAGVDRFVLSGVIHPFITEMRNHCAKLPVNEALIKSGLAYTILQPTNLMQSIEAFVWDKIVATGEFVEPWGIEQRICYVDYRDVAEVVVKALTQDSLQYGVFDLASRGRFASEDIATMISDALGRPIKTRVLTVDQFVNENLPPVPVLRESFVDLGNFYARYGFPGDNDLVLRTILGRAPRTLLDYIKELAARERDKSVGQYSLT